MEWRLKTYRDVSSRQGKLKAATSYIWRFVSRVTFLITGNLVRFHGSD